MFDPKLKTFLTLCETGSYTQTAAMLNLTQPAVTQHIKALESYYDTKLFYHDDKRRLCLTSHGELLRSYSQSLVADSNIIERAMRLPPEHADEFGLGILTSAGDSSLIHFIAEYIRRYPRRKVRICLGEANTLVAQLESGELHACIIDTFCSGEDFENIELFTSDVICVCSPKHPLAGKTADFDLLHAYRLIFRENGSRSQANLANILSKYNQTPDDFLAYLEAGSIYAVKKLVMEDIGISFIYKYIVQEDLDNGSLCQIHVKDFSIRYIFNLVWMKNSFFSQDTIQFLNVYHKTMPE